MDEEKIELLYRLLHRPIIWDPVPPWLKLTKEQLDKFTRMEFELQKREIEIQQQKLKELGNIIGLG